MGAGVDMLILLSYGLISHKGSPNNELWIMESTNLLTKMVAKDSTRIYVEVT